MKLSVLMLVVALASSINSSLLAFDPDNLSKKKTVQEATMGRLRSIGYEVGFSSLGFEGNRAATSFRDTAFKRSGTASLQCDSTGSGLAADSQFTISSTEIGALPVTLFWRCYFFFNQLPQNSTAIMKVTAANNVFVRTDSTGAMELYVGGVKVAGPTAAGVLTTGAWYRIELSYALAVGATDALELRVEGASLLTASGLTISDAAPSSFNNGWVEGPGASRVCYVDDVAVNNNTGVTQNSWPGEGKIALLLPISDSQVGSWTGGVGGVTNLFEAVNNTPPIGTDTETDLTQIESADGSGDNATDEYRANMTSYSTAGLVAADTITLCQAVVDHGEDIITGTKTGSFLILSNPAQVTADTFTFGDDLGALLPWSANWATKWGAAQVAPFVTLGTSPVMRVRKTDTGTRVGSVDFMGIYVEYVSVAVATVAHRLPLMGAGR